MVCRETGVDEPAIRKLATASRCFEVTCAVQNMTVRICRHKRGKETQGTSKQQFPVLIWRASRATVRVIPRTPRLAQLTWGPHSNYFLGLVNKPHLYLQASSAQIAA